MSEEKLQNSLEEIKRDIEELWTRISATVQNSNMTIDSTKDDVRVIPDYIDSLKGSLKGLKDNNMQLEEKDLHTQQSIETVKTEIEISEVKKSELETTERTKREQKEELERKILDFQQKNAQLESEFNQLTSDVQSKEMVYEQLQVQSKETIDSLDVKINEASSRLVSVENENKLIVYLMDAGLMDVPEAEVVATIASHPSGLKLADIKEKVNMPPVRVQPTINNLLETVIEYDALNDSYKIIETIKKDLV